MANKEWFDSIPIEEYQRINKESASFDGNEPVSEPIGGVDIRCGPILKLMGTLEDKKSNYRGNLMIVVKDASVQPKITYKIGPSSEEAGAEWSEGEFPGRKFYKEDGFSFYRYDVEFTLAKYEQKVKYAINSVNNGSYQFYIPSVSQSMNVISFSCNGFSLGTDTSNYKSSLWCDVLTKHEKNHYHVMLGGGDQIYSDSIKLHSQKLQNWLNESNPIKKRRMKITPDALKDFDKYYLNHYMAWFGKGYWVGKNGNTLQSLFPMAMSQIASVNIYDDHDIIDGFGSYSDFTMNEEVFKAVGNVAYKYYMIFQHMINPEEEAHLNDPAWILGKEKGPFIEQKSHSNYVRLGKEISLLGLDCRTERKLKEIVKPSTYELVFDRLNKELDSAPDVKHLLVMLGVPILYPRLVWLEWILTSPLLYPLKKLASRGIINRGLVNEFDGGVEVLDDLNDHWCSKHHKKERNSLMKRLVEFGSSKGIRITILSGDVHLACVGRLKSKIHHYPNFHLLTGTPEEIANQNYDVLRYPENDPRLIFNVISSAIVNAPPPDAMASLLEKRTKVHHFSRDCDEDVVPIFQSQTNGDIRDNHKFLNQRNWCDLIIGRQSIYKDQVDKGIRKFPGPLRGNNSYKERSIDEKYIKYPLQGDCLVTTIHVEDDPSDFKAESADYELYIPRLSGKYQLDVAKIKHLN